MAIPENRLSTELIDANFISPEGRNRVTFLQDYEGGPIALQDTSEGINYQVWSLKYTDPNFVITPETTGTPQTILTVAGCEQVSFCFDQNARPSVVYIIGTDAFLYWYDTTYAQFVTTKYSGITSAMLSLDDKRALQVGVSDIIFWYTREDPVTPGVYYLYHRKQRERFFPGYEMRQDPEVAMPVPPYLWKAGMHKGLRGKVTLTYRTP